MSAKSQGRAAAAEGKSSSSNPYKTVFWGDRPGDNNPERQRKYDEWKEDHADKKQEMEKK